ncbi:hypothetical protein MKW92_013179, partial [Papaver armeniacum]
MREAETNSEDFHQINHIHINLIFQPSKSSSTLAIEMNHTDQLLTPERHLVEGDIEMSERAIESHAYGDIVHGIHGNTANTV